MKTVLKLIATALLVVSLFTIGYAGEKGNSTNCPQPGMEQFDSNLDLFSSCYPTGKLKCFYNKSTHEYTSYYPSGKVEEKGYWFHNHYVGEFIRYHSNGNIWHEFYFNSEGKQEGAQVYYHNNSRVAIAGNWLNGKVEGPAIRYYESGQVKSTAVYFAGKIDSLTIVRYNDVSKQDNFNSNISFVQF
ncbi:MAG: hypothetical protein JKY42_06505 [Flavobacteriales bacterium]|nr:hypothetical protein [Flavobacteriales bacterium]